MSLKKLVSSSICTAMLFTAVSAQETKPDGIIPQQSNSQAGAGRTSSQGAATITPQQIAAGLALDNQEEVILGKFAQEKSKNKEVASFAKMLAEEHQGNLKKLSKFSPETSREGYLTENVQQDQTKSGSTSGTTNKAASGSTTAGIDMMQLHREIAQQCIADSKKYLNEKDGDKFDVCFVGMQIAKHAAMHTKLVVLQRHTTDELQQLVSESLQATEKHMKAAEALMAKLDNSDSASKSGK